MTTHLKIPALSSHPAAWMRVFQSKSSISATMFSGIGGFVDMHANQPRPTVKNNSKNNSVILLYANTNSTKRTHQQRDTDDEYDTKNCCCNPHCSGTRDGRTGSCEEGTEHNGGDVLVRPRLAEYLHRGSIVSDGTEETGRPSRSCAQGANREDVDRRHDEKGTIRTVQYVYWQGSSSTVLFSTNGRG